MSEAPSHPTGYMKKESAWLMAFVALACGFLAGIVFSVYKGGGGPEQTNRAQATQQNGGSPQVNAQNQSALLALEQEVLKNPGNAEAWTRLGNLYFDEHRFDKAIEAYNKSLEVNPSNADVLTDLGVMYRRNGMPGEAIAAFDRAIAANPDHQTARFNRGIVQLYDLRDRDGALATWEELVRRHPQALAANGQPVTELIKVIREQQP